MKRLVEVLIILSIARPTAAHVGSPDVYFEGNAGPYRLFVTIRVPQVVPGVAEIEIRSASPDVHGVKIVPLRLTGPGSQYPPAPDVAERSKDDPQFFAGSLWLMEFGSLQVRIFVDGARGKGELAVPVLAQAQRVLPMPKSLGVLLFFLLLLLAVGLVNIVGAAAREAKLEPGAHPTVTSGRRGRIVMAVTAVLVLGLLYLGNQWWNLEARAHTANIYKNPHSAASVESGHLVLRPTDEQWLDSVRKQPLIPDHNHLVHLFLIRSPQMDRFWHLHPDQVEPGLFATYLPPVSAGHYQIFADVVHPSGFPETILATIDLPDVAGEPLIGDDSAAYGPPILSPPRDARVWPLPDGARMVWDSPAEPPKVTMPAEFRFRVEDGDGKPVQDLEPYMGMAAHVAIVRSDFTVFAHVHPAGSVSMAALELAQQSFPGGGPAALASTSTMPGMAMAAEHLPPEISFPYGFPRPGTYRIFVQVKRPGQIQTGVFDASVQ